MSENLEGKRKEAAKMKRIYHPAYFILAVGLGVFIGKRWADWPLIPSGETYILATTLTVMAMSMMKDRFFQTMAVRTLEDIRDDSKTHATELREWIIARLNPAILSLEGRDDVLGQAASIIQDASDEGTQGYRYVVYFGSAELNKEPAATEDRNSPLNDYLSAIAQLGNKGVRVTRYISLLEPSDQRLRWPNRQDEYKSWINKQIVLLEQNSGYELFDCPRAPSWGSTRSSIITARALLDVVGNGQSGVLIRGDEVAQDMLKSSREILKTAHVPALLRNAQSLRIYLQRLDSGGATAEGQA